MKAISLWQPWATLIAENQKQYEFRTWPVHPNIIGQRIAIHAAARRIVKYEIKELIQAIHCGENIPGLVDHEVCAEMLRHMHLYPEQVVLGKIVATAVVGEPVSPEDLIRLKILQRLDPSYRLWGWPLTEVQKLPRPIAMAGRQGFWDWDGNEAT